MTGRAFNAWRSLGAIGLAIAVAMAGSTVVTGLTALQRLEEGLARQSLDNIDFLASQFEVAYLDLALGISAVRDNTLPLSEVEARREKVLVRLARFNTGEAGRAPEVSPEIARLARQLEGLITDLPLAGAAPDLNAAATRLAAARSDASQLRAASQAFHAEFLSRNREAANKAYRCFALSLGLMAVVALMALAGIAASLARRRAQGKEIRTADLGAQQQASLAQLLEDISNLLLRYGVDGRLQFAKGVEIADLDVFDFFRRSGRPRCLDALGTLTPAQPGITHEVVGVRDADGRERIERWSHRLIVAANGAADGFVSTAQDITELRTLNEQLIQSSKLVALGEISAGIAHELMQPLNALKIGLANLRRRQTSGGAETPEEAAARFDRLERQVSRAGDVVHTMRLLGRQSDLKLSPVAIDDLLEEAFQLFDRPLAVLGITLAVERPGDELFVLAHPQFLLQVLINLLANARDALEDGTEDDADRRVHLSVGTDGTGRVVVEVRDNGPGIPPHLMDRVVEPFFTTKAPGKGMGLGLALSNRLVLLFGGTLEFGNQAAGGAFFRIGLRRAVAMESNTRQARAGRETPRQRDPGQGA